MCGTKTTKQPSKKKKSSNKTGLESEKKTHRYLVDLGYNVHSVGRPAYRGQSHDIFGLHDHIAKLPIMECPPIVVQTKTGKYLSLKPGKKEEMIALFYPLQFVFLWFEEELKIQYLKDNKFITITEKEFQWIATHTYKLNSTNVITLFE